MERKKERERGVVREIEEKPQTAEREQRGRERERERAERERVVGERKSVRGRRLRAHSGRSGSRRCPESARSLVGENRQTANSLSLSLSLARSLLAFGRHTHTRLSLPPMLLFSCPWSEKQKTRQKKREREEELSRTKDCESHGDGRVGEGRVSGGAFLA